MSANLRNGRRSSIRPDRETVDLVCGRFTSSQRREAIGERFEVAVPESYAHRFNLAPQQRTLIIRERDDAREAAPHARLTPKLASVLLDGETVSLAALTRSVKGVSMSHMGKSHLVIMWTVGPDDVAEGDRIFASHGEWMKGHPRDGDAALLEYTVSKGPELSNPMDPTSEPTGKTIFVIDEYYESPAGIARHWQDAADNWPDLPAAMAWGAKGTVATLHNGTAVQAL